MLVSRHHFCLGVARGVERTEWYIVTNLGSQQTDRQSVHRRANMKTRTRVLVAIAVAGALAAMTALLLLGGHVSAAIWMEGPYYLLSRLLPGSIDTLLVMVAAVAFYYFAASLIALKASSRRALVLVVASVIALNTLAEVVWHRQAYRSASSDTRTSAVV